MGGHYYTNNEMKDIAVGIIQEIGRFSTDEIYLIDLVDESYRSVNFRGETQCNNENHVDVTFFTTKNGKRIAEIKIEPTESKITVKYNFNNLRMVLYDPNTGRSFYVLKGHALKEWLDYNIYIDSVSGTIKIIRMKNKVDYVTKL